MASGANKFKFISPGIFTFEVDRSQIPAEPTAMGPVIIGRTSKGPANRPVKVSSYAEFVSVFGEPHPGGADGDMWRTTSFEGPTYASYAARAWLDSGEAPVTMIRTLGVDDDQAGSGIALAGWDTTGVYTSSPNLNGGAYGLWLIDATSSVGTVSSQYTGSLAAVWYMEEGYSIRLQGNVANRGFGITATTASAATLIENKANQEFVAEIMYDDGTALGAGQVVKEKVCFNLDPDSPNFIRKTFCTNPVLTNSTVTDSTSDSFKGYWLGHSFEQFVTRTITGSAAGTVFGFVAALSSGSTAGNVSWDDFKGSAQNGQTPFFFGQDLGPNDSYQEAGQTDLFKLVALDQGEWLQRNVKVTIDEIRASDYPDVDPYGSFSVVLRHATDNDVKPQPPIERYDNLNLNPESVDYIVRRIGDKYMEWDATNRRLVEYGDYDNISKYVRVEVTDDVAAGGASPDLLPFGYMGPPRFSGYAIFSGSEVHKSNAYYTLTSSAPSPTLAVTGNTTVLADTNIPWSPTEAAGGGTTFISTGGHTTMNSAFGFSGSYNFPAMLLRNSASDGGLADPRDASFGILTTRTETSLKFDHSYYDMVRPLPLDISSFVLRTNAAAGPVTEASFAFSMDNVVSSSTADNFYYLSGSRLGGASMTAQTGKTYKDLLEAGYRSFTAPIHGAFDGFDITEKEPLSNTVLAVNNTSLPRRVNNYAYNTLERAVEIAGDPTLVEGNLLTVPGTWDTGITDQVINTAEDRADMLGVIDIQYAYTPKFENTQAAADRKPDVTQAINTLIARSINSSYGCTYFPWVQITDPSNSRVVDMPPSVVALGTFGGSQRDTELWFAPAGFRRGGLTDGAAGLPVTGVKARLSAKDRDNLYAANINPIATFPSEGIVVFGQKTLQVQRSALDRINVRRLLIFIKKEVSRIASSVLFDPNLETTWLRFTSAVNPFLADVQARFGLSDFKVVLDADTTTPDLVDRNIMYAKIFLQPARAIEFIALDFIIQRTGASFDD
jgi:hypothetical protein